MTTSRLVVIPTRRAHSNYEQVARGIGIDIIAGRYAEGARLPGDADLTASFGVSRPVLREAVKTLVAKGLLTTKAGVGTVVRGRDRLASLTMPCCSAMKAKSRMPVAIFVHQLDSVPSKLM